MDNRPKVLILGHGRHGKDTVAEILRKKHGLKYSSSSQVAFGAIKPALICVTGITDETTLYRQRRHNRVLWRELISLYNTPDKSSLVKLILKNNNVYVGMRSKDEFNESIKYFDLILWVDAFKRIFKSDPSMEIQYDPNLMQLIDNNGSVKFLERQLEGLKKWL